MNIPFNCTTGAPYSMNNTALLLQSGFASPEWATYRQWLSAGRQVEKGQVSTRLKRVCVKQRKDGTDKKYVKTFSVFNIEQTKEVEADLNTCSPEEFTAHKAAELHSLASSSKDALTSA